MHREALRLLLTDLRQAFDSNSISTARNRLRLFELMYMQNAEPKQESDPLMVKQVLLLKLSGGDYAVCDEYYPEDYGRVHLIPQNCYGHFHKDEMQLEYRKVAMDVVSIEYQGHVWPTGLTDVSANGVLSYFGVTNP